MTAITYLLWAFVLGISSGKCLRASPRFHCFRMPLCSITPMQGATKCANTGSVFLLFPEKAQKRLRNSKEINIGGHTFKLIEGTKAGHDFPGNSDRPQQSGKQESNKIYAIGNGYKIGLNELKDETIFEKRSNHSNILELTKMALLFDGVIVPLEYNDLITKGADLYQLKLIDVVLFVMRHVGRAKLNIHFVVYNMPSHGMDTMQKEFHERHKNEIEEQLRHMIRKESSLIYATCSFSESKDPMDDLTAIEPFIATRIALKQSCKSQFESETRNHMETIKKLGSLQEFMGSSVNDVAGTLKGADFSRDVSSFHQVLEQAKTVELKLNSWLQQNGMMLGELPSKLKSEVDTMIYTLLSEYDTFVAALGNIKTPHLNAVRAKLVDSLQNKLSFLMNGMILKIQDAVLQEYQESLQSLPVDENLDMNLQDAIAKFDNRYCALAEECTFEILKTSKLYEIRAQMQRRDLIENMKEVANHILEYAIGKGLFHSKLSIVEGMSYIPSNFLTRLIKRFVSKIRIPLHISLNYLSPSAFGLSNLFRDRIPLKPGVVRYFTGDNGHSMFTTDETTRKQANSLVHKEP